MKQLVDLLNTFYSDEFVVSGFLNSMRGPHAATIYSDLDLFLIQCGGKPSSYFLLAERLILEICEINEPIVLFSSFKQQMLLKDSSVYDHPLMIHYLHYLSIRHLVSREINTLPYFVPKNLEIINSNNPSVTQDISSAYNSRSQIIHPSWLRFYYYFDVANETLPMLGNLKSQSLPPSMLQHEIFHKIKFLSQCLSLEIYSGQSDNAKDLDMSRSSEIIDELGFSDLSQLSREVKLLSEKNNDFSLDWFHDAFLSIYTSLDKIEILSDFQFSG